MLFHLILDYFSEPYGELAQCDWHISVSQGSTIDFVISDLDLEEQIDCIFDYLEVKIFFYMMISLHFDSLIQCIDLRWAYTRIKESWQIL